MRLLFLIFLIIPSIAFAQSDADIRDKIIEQSIKNYPGACPCPYSRTSKGHKCGKRSAYSKPGGASPKCYPSDVSDKDVKEYRTK